MEAPKGIFQRAYNTLFGDTTPLRNDSTIEFGSNLDFSRNNSARSLGSRGGHNLKRNESNYNSVVDELGFSDSDEDIGSEVDFIFNNYTLTQDRIKSLPEKYPGSFPRASNASEQGYHNRPNVANHELSKDILHGSGDLADSSLGELAFLPDELGTSKKNQLLLSQAIEQISLNNDFLESMEYYVSMSGEVESLEVIKGKYQKLRQEYIEELEKCSKFYKAYYTLVKKYKEKKLELKKVQAGIVPTSSNVRLKEKINNIITCSSSREIKNLCNDALIEIRNNDLETRKLKDELEKSNERIKQLESGIA